MMENFNPNEHKKNTLCFLELNHKQSTSYYKRQVTFKLICLIAFILVFAHTTFVGLNSEFSSIKFHQEYSQVLESYINQCNMYKIQNSKYQSHATYIISCLQVPYVGISGQINQSHRHGKKVCIFPTVLMPCICNGYQ